MRPLLYDEHGRLLVMRDDEKEENFIVDGENVLDAEEEPAAFGTFGLPTQEPLEAMKAALYEQINLQQVVPYERPDVVMPDGSRPKQHRRVARGTFDFEPGEEVVVAITFDVKPAVLRETVANDQRKRQILRRLSPNAADRERELREAKKRETLRKLQTPKQADLDDAVAKDIRMVLDGLHRRDVL